MKSKNLAFLLLVGLIAPSAVMSVESFNTVTQDTERLIFQNKRALEEKFSALKDRATECLTIHDTGDAPHPLKKPGNFLSKEDLNNVSKFFEKKLCKFFENTLNFEKEFKSDIEKYCRAYTTLQPDSWDETLNALLKSDRMSIFLKLQAIQNAVSKIFKDFPYTMPLTYLNKTKEDLNFIKNVSSFERLSSSGNKKLNELKEINNKFNNMMEDMRLSIKALENSNECEKRDKNSHFLDSFFEENSADHKKRNEDEKYLDFTHFFDPVGKYPSTEFYSTQKNILENIEIILDYIENSSEQNSSEQDLKRDQKAEEKSTAREEKNGKRHGGLGRDSGRDSDK